MARGCEGDKVAGINYEAECYAKDACPGCWNCWLKCEGCENCEELENEKLRDPRVGDYIVVHQKLTLDPNWTGTWSGAMDEGLGRVAYIAEGNPRDGFKLKFTTTNTEVLDHFVWPAGCMKLAMLDDNRSDVLIKRVKGESHNTNL